MNNLNSADRQEQADTLEVGADVSARIASIRKTILTSLRFVIDKRDDVLGNWENKVFESMLARIEKELAANPDVLEGYDSIVIQGNREALEKKTQLQLKALQQYARNHGIDMNAVQSGFGKWVRNMKVVRNDVNAAEFEEFLSPRTTGNVNSFNRVDSFVQADRFVYASLDDLPHPLTGFDKNAHTFIDEMEACDRAEIAMMDVDALRYSPEGIIRSYANNLFDFNGGKEIVSLYLATVFRTPEEARAFHEANIALRLPRSWQQIAKLEPQQIVAIFEAAKRPEYSPSLSRLKIRVTNPGSFKLLQEASVILENAGITPRRMGEIFERMCDIEKNLGIVPPLSLEVKIKDSAKIQRDRSAA